MEDHKPPEYFVKDKFILHLYVAGMSENSMRAIENIKQLCEEHLKDCFELEIIDVYKNPEVALKQNIILSPSLVKELPLPRITLVGDLSDTSKVILGLGITFVNK